MSLMILIPTSIISFSTLLMPYGIYAWSVVMGPGSFAILLTKVSKKELVITRKANYLTAIGLISVLAAGVSQVIAANDLPSNHASLHTLPKSSYIYLVLGGIASFILVLLVLNNERWAKGGAVLAAAGLYTSIIFFRVAAVPEVGSVYLVIASFLLIFWFNREKIFTHIHQDELNYWKWIIFLIIILAFSTLASPVIGQSIDYIFDFILLILLTGCIASFLKSFKELTVSGWIIFILGAVIPVFLALIKILDIATIFDLFMALSYRYHPTEMGGANIIARSLLISAPFGITIILLESSSNKLKNHIKIFGLLTLEILVLSFIAYARSFEGFFAWIFTISIYLFLVVWEHIHKILKQMKTRKLFLIIIVSIVALILGGLFFMSIRTAVNVNPFSFNTRFANWYSAFFATHDTPLLGGGPDNEYLYTRFSDKIKFISKTQEILDDPLYQIRFRSGILTYHAHNVILEIAAFTGIGGLIGILGIWYSLFRIGIITWRRGDKQEKLLSAACIAGISGEIAWGLLDVTRQTPPFFSFPVWAIIGLLLALYRSQVSKKPEDLSGGFQFRLQPKVKNSIIILLLVLIIIGSLGDNQYASGFLAFQEKRWETAAKNLNRAVVFNPLSANDYFMLSKTNLELGEYQEAQENLAKANSLKKGYSPYLTQAGWLAWLLGDRITAGQFFEEAIENDPLEGWTHGLHIFLGMVRYSQSDRPSAVHLITESLKYHPDLAAEPYWVTISLPDGSRDVILDPTYVQDEVTHDLKIRLLYHLGVSNITSRNFSLVQTSDGVIRLNEVLDAIHEDYEHELTEGNSDAHLLLAAEAESAYQAGLYERAINCYLAYQVIQPESAFGYRDLARVYLETNQLDQAQEAINQANKVSPEDLETMKPQVRLYLLRGDLHKAEKALASTRNVAEGDAFHWQSFDLEILSLWKEIKTSQNDLDSAAEIQKWITKIRGNPEDYLALTNYEEQYSQQEKTEACWQAYDILIKNWSSPYDPRFWDAAVCLANSQDTDQEIIKRSSRGQENYYQYLLNGHIFRLRNQVALAEKYYLQAIHLRDDLGALHYHLGELYFTVSDYKKAETEFQLSAKLDSYEPLALMRLGQLYEMTGNSTLALEAYQDALRRTPGWGDVHLALANLNVKIGNTTEADKYYKNAAEIDGQSSSGKIFTFLGNLSKAQISPHPQEGLVKGDYFTINGERKLVIFMHPESSATYTLDLSNVADEDEMYLNFSIGLSPDCWDQVGDGVNFAIQKINGDSTQEIFSKYINPKENIKDRKWHPFNIKLDAYSNQVITLKFITDGGPSDDISFDWAGWGAPQVIILP